MGLIVAISHAPHQGWGAVEQRLARATEQNRVARTPAEFAAVGNTCAETLLLLLPAMHAFDEERAQKIYLSHSLHDLLAAYAARALGDGRSSIVVKGSLADAANSIEIGTSEPMAAALCLAATTTVVQYLSIATGRRQPRETIKDLCEWFLANTPDVGASQAYTVQKLASSSLGQVVAAQLTTDDVFVYSNARRTEGISGATLSQDLTYLRGVFLAAREKLLIEVTTAPIDWAKDALRKAGMIGQSPPRKRRITREELQSLVTYFERPQSRAHPSKIPMRDIMEFALWSARRISEICALRWADFDPVNRTCLVKVSDARGKVRPHEFPLLGKAFDIVMRQPKTDDRIFPHKAKSASAAYARAKKELGIENLRFQDLRREAAIRLHEAGHSLEQIAKVTGRTDLNTLLKDISAPAHVPYSVQGMEEQP